MSDLQLAWNPASMSADLLLSGPDLARDEGLRTAIIISLFTDARAADDDQLEDGADRRGWWGDVGAEVDGDQYGSRLWLLAREKQLPKVLRRAEQYAGEALAWLIADGVALTVKTTATFPATGMLGLAVEVARPTGPDRARFDFAWSAS
jgi:phage gp46-like protein